MSTASRHAYDTIIPELPAREAAVMRVLLEARGSWPAGIKCALTNRQIAGRLGLERDSVSPRTARLRQKGLIIEVGVDEKETLYEAVIEPKFVKKPEPLRPTYNQGVLDAIEAICTWQIKNGVKREDRINSRRAVEEILK